MYIAVALRTAWCQYTLRYIWYFAKSSDSSADSPFSHDARPRGAPVVRIVDERERVDQPVDVDLAVLHAAHERVALEILDLVEVERAGDQPLQRAVALAADERDDALGRVVAELVAQHRRRPRRR